jgi:hypothetical protein
VLEQSPLLQFAVRRDHEHALGDLSPLLRGHRDLGGRERRLQALGERRLRGGSPDGVGEQPGQHVFPAEQDLPLIGEVPEERGAVQAGAVRDLRDGGFLVPVLHEDELIAAGPIAARITNMQAALAAADRGVRSCLVMLPRSVHGEGERHGFIPQLIALARAKGISGYIGDGTSRWPAVHVKDAASLYRLAVEQAPAGAVLNAVGDEGVPVREIAEAIGEHLNLRAKSLPAAEYIEQGHYFI